MTVRLLLLLLLLSQVVVSTSHTKKTDEKKKEETSKNEKTDGDKKEDGKDAKKESKPEPGCNANLLQTLRLDGISKGEKAKDMLICGNVKSGNNCCSAVDEIKILKSWNGYSEPKLKQFVEDTSDIYKRILNLDPFVKKLDDSYMRLHYDKYTWKRVSQTKCFNGQYFVDKTQLNKLMSETGKGDSWFDIFAKKLRTQVIEALISTVKSHDFCKIESFNTHVVQKLQKDKAILKKLRDINLDYAYESDKNDILTTILKLFTTIAPKDVNASKKELEKGVYEVAKIKLKFDGVFDKLLRTNIHKKELKTLHEATYKNQLSELQKFFEKEKDKLFNTIHFGKTNKDELIKDIFEKLKKNIGLKFHLSYFLDLKYIKDKEFDNIIQETKGALIKALTKIIISTTKIKGVNHYTALQHFLKALGEHYKIKEIIYKGMLHDLVPHLMIKLISEAYKELEKKHADKKEDLIKQFKDMVVKYDYSKAKVAKHPNLHDAKFDNIHPQIMEKAYLLYKDSIKPLNLEEGERKLFVGEVVDYLFDKKDSSSNNNSGGSSQQKTSSSSTTPPKPTFDINQHIQKDLKTGFEPYWTIVKKEFEELLKLNVYVSTGKGDKVCAVIYKHNLMKETYFNKKKLDFCGTTLRKLLKINVKEMLDRMDTVKIEIKKMAELKKSFYCTVCDSNAGVFLQFKNNKIVYSNQFCFDLLKEFRRYIAWKNDKFITYTENLFQYLKCFQTDGHKGKFPFKFFGEDHMKLISRIKQCEKPKDVKAAEDCVDICEQFDLVNYSNFFDGERKFLEEMYSYILYIIRMFGFTFSKPIANSEEKVRILEEVNENGKRVLTSKQHLINNNEEYFDNKGQYEIIKENLRNLDDNSLLFGRQLSEKTKKTEEAKKEGDKKEGEKKEGDKKEQEKTPEQMVKYLLGNLDKMSAPTRANYMTLSEINTSTVNYPVNEPNIDFTKVKATFDKNGLNPFQITKQVNFDMGLLETMYKGKVATRVEPWNANAVRDYVTIDDGELNKFNFGLADLVIDIRMPDIKEVEDDLEEDKGAEGTEAKENIGETIDDDLDDEDIDGDGDEPRELRKGKKRHKRKKHKAVRKARFLKDNKAKAKAKINKISKNGSDKVRKLPRNKTGNSIKSFFAKLLFV